MPRQKYVFEKFKNAKYWPLPRYLLVHNTCCISFQDRKQGLPEHSSPPCCLAAGKHASVHARVLTSFCLLVLLSNLKPNYHCNIFTSLYSIGIPSPLCFILLPASTSNYLEYYVCRKLPKENLDAARQISLLEATEKLEEKKPFSHSAAAHALNLH